MLTITDLSAGYGGISALKGISLRVPAGRMVALIGPNGAGKSTLLNAISEIVAEKAGEIVYRGQDIGSLPAHRIARAGLVQVPEGRQILGPLSVEENLILGKIARRESRRNGTGLRYETEDIFQLFPILKERRRQDGGSLSGGQQQMLAIARALLGWPDLLMLDEPSLGLAPLLTQQVYAALKTLLKQGQTILLVEQNARRALSASDYVYVIEQGRIVQEGEAATVANDPRIINHYLPEKRTEHRAD